MGELTKKQEYIFYLFNSGMTVSEIARLTGTANFYNSAKWGKIQRYSGKTAY